MSMEQVVANAVGVGNWHMLFVIRTFYFSYLFFFEFSFFLLRELIVACSGCNFFWVGDVNFMLELGNFLLNIYYLKNNSVLYIC